MTPAGAGRCETDRKDQRQDDFLALCGPRQQQQRLERVEWTREHESALLVGEHEVRGREGEEQPSAARRKKGQRRKLDAALVEVGQERCSWLAAWRGERCGGRSVRFSNSLALTSSAALAAQPAAAMPTWSRGPRVTRRRFRVCRGWAKMTALRWSAKGPALLAPWLENARRDASRGCCPPKAKTKSEQ